MMNPGDLIKNKRTHVIALILNKTHWSIPGYGYGETMEQYDYEILLPTNNDTMIVTYNILQDHWERIDES